MTATVRQWFAALSQREQYLVAIAGALTALIALIFGIALTVSAIDEAEASHDAAVERRGRIEAKLANMALGNGRQPAVNLTAIDLVITQSAAEQGFDLVKAPGSAAGQLSFRMEQARSPALLAWLAALEAQGIEVRTLALRSGGNGNVTVDAQLRQTSK